MPKPSLRDGERVPSSTRTYESNAVLLGTLLWAVLLAFVVGFVFLGDQLRTPSPKRVVSLLGSVFGVVAVAAFSWPLTYRLLSGRRRDGRKGSDPSARRRLSGPRGRRDAAFGQQGDVDDEERERVSDEVDVHVNAD